MSSSSSTCASGMRASRRPRHRPGVRVGGRHGGHGVHLGQPRHDHSQQRADQPPYARSGAGEAGVSRALFTSSACMYPEQLQLRTDIAGLKEDDAYPAAPQDAYGWEKMFTELLCTYYPGEFDIETRIGPVPQHLRTATVRTTGDARSRRPRCAARSRSRKTAVRSRCGATASRRVRSATSTTASRASIDSCSRTTTSRSTSAPTAWSASTSSPASSCSIADKQSRIEHMEGPEGVRGRNSDNTRLREVLGWEPGIDLEEGLAETYRWIEKQLDRAIARSATARSSDVTPSRSISPRRRARRWHRARSNPDLALREITRWIDDGYQHYVCVTGVHGVMESQRRPGALADPQRVGAHDAGRHADGVGRACRRARNTSSACTGPTSCSRSANARRSEAGRCYLYGATDDVLEQLAQRLTERFPGLKVVGWHSPPFRRWSRRKRTSASCGNQRRRRPHRVGRAQHAEAGTLDGVAPRTPACGGAASASAPHSTSTQVSRGQAPRWMQRSGLEWLFRLCKEPRRLWRRYMVNNPRFLIAVLRRRPHLRRVQSARCAAIARTTFREGSHRRD